MVLLITSHDLMYPALVAGHSDTMRATDTEVAPSYGDVSTARLWTPVLVRVDLVRVDFERVDLER